MLATVKRGKYHSISSLNLSHGLWGDIFPDIYDTSVDDIIKKFTHEEDYGQLLTISDPRHTESADPDFFESSNYFLHLTHYSYKSNITSNFHLLNKIETPSTTSPAGTDLGPSIVQMSLYDEHGRILETIGPEGLVTLTTYYEHNSGLLEGFLRETELDPGGLSIRTAVDRDELGRIIKNYSPKFFDDEDDKFTGTITYNDLSQIITISTNSSFNFKLHRNYDQVGNIKQESYDRKRFGGVLYDEPLEVKTYDYDEEFQVTKTKFGGIKHPNYKVSHNIYDIAGRLLFYLFLLLEEFPSFTIMNVLF